MKQSMTKGAKKRSTAGKKYQGSYCIKHQEKRKGEKTAGRQAQSVCSKNKVSCPVYGKCGGCQLLGEDYTYQLQKKTRYMTKLLKPFGKVEPIMGMEQPYYYRNKTHAVFAQTRGGKVYSGSYKTGTHEVVPIEKCLIENKKADAIISTIRKLLPSFKLTAFNEDTGQGFLRHVLIRTAHKTGQILVVLVTGSVVFPSKKHFIEALRAEHPEITTIVQNINGKKTSMILGEKEKVLFGKGYIEDQLCGAVFRISPQSFYQVNPVQTEKLYNLAIEAAALTGKERVLDAYCGIGTIGIVAGQQAGSVIGVELNGEAVKDAERNAKLSGIQKIQFYHQDAGKFMCELAEAGEKIDVVFMDPPRAGSDMPFLKSVLKLAPRRVIYISCNPETLKRDLEVLTKGGYKVEKIQPVDMFPHTVHVETVCLLSRKAPV